MTKRRDKGSGSIHRDLERGGYKGELRLDGKRYIRRGKTKAQVTDRLNALKREHARGTLSVDQATTVAALMDHYLERVVPNRKGGNLSPTALYRYRWCAGHIVEHIGKKRAAALTVREIETMLDKLAARGMSRDSLSKIRNVLRGALNAAVRRGDLARNVAEYAELPGKIREERRRYSLTPDMVQRLIAGCADDRIGVMYAVQIALALRPGEAAGLYWDDVDLDAGVVNVTRGRQTDDRGHAEIIDSLKTAKSKRTLEIPGWLVEMLRAHRSRQREERLAAHRWVNDRLVFTSTVGSPLQATAVRRHLDDLCNRLGVFVDADGVERPPLPYELRHTGTSLYSDAGVAQEQIADLMGLASTRMIEARYRHRLRPAVSVARVVDISNAG